MTPNKGVATQKNEKKTVPNLKFAVVFGFWFQPPPPPPQILMEKKDESRKTHLLDCTFHEYTYTSGMYLFGSGSLNSDLKNGKTLGEAVFNMSMKSGSKLPSKYKPLFHFSTSVQIPEVEMISEIYGSFC